jgi:hypothetical protein
MNVLLLSTLLGPLSTLYQRRTRLLIPRSVLGSNADYEATPEAPRWLSHGKMYLRTAITASPSD